MGDVAANTSAPVIDALSWREWLTLDLPAPDWLVPGLLERGSGALLHGGPRSYKSFLMLQLCLDLSAGREPLGVFPPGHPRHTLLFQAEGSMRGWRQRMLNLANDYPSTLPFWSRHSLTDKLDSPSGNKLVKATLHATGAELVVVDPIANFFTGADTDPVALERWRYTSNRWREEFNCAVLWVHHDRQPLRSPARGEFTAFDGGMEEARGRTEIIGWADLVMGLRRKDSVTTLRVQKVRDDVDEREFSFQFAAGRLVPTTVKSPLDTAILTSVGEGAWLADVVKTTTAALAVQSRTVERAAARLVEAGALTTSRVGRRIYLSGVAP